MNQAPVHSAPFVLSASTMQGDVVRNPAGEDLGRIEEIMIDVRYGRIAYAVLSFGGVFGLGEKLFAIPWGMMALNADSKYFLLDVSREQLEQAEGFDQDNWPDFAEETYHTTTYGYWGELPYWAR